MQHSNGTILTVLIETAGDLNLSCLGNTAACIIVHGSQAFQMHSKVITYCSMRFTSTCFKQLLLKREGGCVTHLFVKLYSNAQTIVGVHCCPTSMV